MNFDGKNVIPHAGSTRLVLLGTGTPTADPDRSGPCAAVIVNEQAYLVDFGPGVVRRAAAACQAGEGALDVKKLHTAFLTHLHSDHVAGLADLLMTPWVLGRESALRLFGPAGTKRMVDLIVAAHQEDIDSRLHGIQPSNDTGYKTDVKEIQAGIVYASEDLQVEAFPVQHGNWRAAFGYRFQTEDRTIVFSGDTVPTQTLVEKARGCDVLVHEVYSQSKFHDLPNDWQQYHAAFHTSTRELAEIASQAKPQLLVLYHQLFWGATDDEIVAEIQESYDGDVVSARDLDVF